MYGSVARALDDEDEQTVDQDACNVEVIFGHNASGDTPFQVPPACPETTMAIIMRGAGGRVSGLDARYGNGGGGAYVAAEITVHGGDLFWLNAGTASGLNGQGISYLYPSSAGVTTALVLASSGGGGGGFGYGFELAGSLARCGDGGGGDAPGLSCTVREPARNATYTINGGAAGSTLVTKGADPNCAVADPSVDVCGGDGYGGELFRGGVSQYGGLGGFGGHGLVGGAAGATIHSRLDGVWRMAGAGGGGGSSNVKLDNLQFPILRSVKLPGQGREPGFASHPRLGIAGRGAPTLDDPLYPHLGRDGIVLLRLGDKVADADFEPLTISVGDATIDEGNVNAEFVVSLSKPSAATVTVQLATAPGTATAGTDYVAISTTLTFAPGVTSRSVFVPIKEDIKDEADETFRVELASPTNALLGDAIAIGTIADDDTPSVFSVANVTIAEGTNNKTVSFTIKRAGAIIQPASVRYATLDGSATAGADYLAASGTLTLAAGQRQKTVAITIVGDLAIEPAESFTMQLSNPQNATIGTAIATATITDDDVPAFSVDDVTIEEGDAGTQQALFTLTLSAASAQITKVTFTTTAATASAGSDFVTKSVVVSFPAGTTSKAVPVTINGDLKIETDETFRVKLTVPVRARIDRGVGVGTILDDD